METKAQEEERLIRRLRERDPQAMVEVYDRYGKLLYSIVLRAVRNGPTAEDITQEIFLRVWNRIHTFQQERGNFEAWLVTIARNRAFDYLRSLRASAPMALASLDDLERAGRFSSEFDESERLVKQKAVTDALRSLPEDQREVLELTHFEGMSQTEIAARLGKPLGTVKSQVRSAVKKLRLAMSGAAASGPSQFGEAAP